MAANLGIWSARLLPASWRGVPFAVTESRIVPGRRTALHEYPNRDEVWVEDLGKRGRAYSFIGFLIGDDVYAQRDLMLTAMDAAGPGVLVHPSIGTVPNAVLVDPSLGERADQGRVVELSLMFIVSGKVLFPTNVTSTPAATNNAADNAVTATQGDFNDSTTQPLTTAGQAVV